MTFEKEIKEKVLKEIKSHILKYKDVEFLLEQVKRNPIFNKRFEYYSVAQFEEYRKRVEEAIDNRIKYLRKSKTFKEEVIELEELKKELLK